VVGFDLSRRRKDRTVICWEDVTNPEGERGASTMTDHKQDQTRENDFPRLRGRTNVERSEHEAQTEGREAKKCSKKVVARQRQRKRTVLTSAYGCRKATAEGLA
jgi:hypothetical protein